MSEIAASSGLDASNESNSDAATTATATATATAATRASVPSAAAVDIAAELRERVVGQPEAVEAAVRCLELFAAGMREGDGDGDGDEDEEDDADDDGNGDRDCSNQSARYSYGRPIAGLLLVGPSGVGKTEMGKALAHVLHRLMSNGSGALQQQQQLQQQQGDGQAQGHGHGHGQATLVNPEELLVRVDMSEYTEAHTVSRLIGAPPRLCGVS